MLIALSDAGMVPAFDRAILSIPFNERVDSSICGAAQYDSSTGKLLAQVQVEPNLASRRAHDGVQGRRQKGSVFDP